MKIKKFWARGYRSLRDVVLNELGPFNIFYGQNGSGKTNILDALQTFFCVVPLAVDAGYGPASERMSFREAGQRSAEWIRDEDFFARDSVAPIILGAEIEDLDDNFSGAKFHQRNVHTLLAEVVCERVRPGQRNLKFSRLLVNGTKPGLPFDDPTIRDSLREIVPQTFTHLGVTRTLSVNAFRDGATPRPRTIGTIPDGEVVQELFAAKNAHDPKLRRRFQDLRAYIATTLGRGEFDVFMGPEGLELRERLPEPNPLGLDIRVDRAGHGIVQVYAILASILLAQGQLVAIEEPEAHLHAPTLGRHLREILKGMVEKGRVHQFFVATHSNLFDLDLTGYWDVALLDGETRVQRKPLDEVDRLHLFEPGPAKHQIQEMLRLYGDEVVFRARDGRRLPASEMLMELQADTDMAKEFLETVHAAAMQVIGLRARRDSGSS